MSEKSLIAIGINCIDEYYSMDNTPALGEKINVNYLDSKVGGMIGNAAAIYAGYGQKTFMIDFINTKPQNDLLVDDLVNCGVDPSLIVRDPDIPDAKCIIMLSKGERIIFVVENERKPLYFTEKQIDELNKSEFIYSTIMDLKRIHNSLNVIDNARKSGTKLVFDIEANLLNEQFADYEYLKRADIIFLNESAHKVFKSQYGDDYVEHFLETAQLVVITKGENGSVIKTKEDNITIDAFKVNPKDTTGAGDTFNASFLYGLSRGWDLVTVGKFANAAAAKSILELGPRSGVSNEQEVLNFISNYND